MRLLRLPGAAVAALLAILPQGSRATPPPSWSTLQLSAGWVDTADAATRDAVERASRAREPLGADGGRRLRLVHFPGPIRPEWRSALEAPGVEVLSYVANGGYLLWTDPTGDASLRAVPAVDFVSDLLPSWKLDAAGRAALSNGHEEGLWAVQLVDDPVANASTLTLLGQLVSEPPRADYRILRYRNLVAALPSSAVGAIAARPDVVSVRPYPVPVKHDERQARIVTSSLSGTQPAPGSYLAWLAAKGFTQAQFDASGLLVDLSDSGVDAGTTSPNHPGLRVGGTAAGASRLSYLRLVGIPNVGSTVQGCDGHGTLNAHILAGFDDLAGAPHVDAAGFHFGLGICPFVRVGSSVIFDPHSFTHPQYPDLTSSAYSDGARISSNSWGAPAFGAYDIDAQAYDALTRDAQPAGSSVPVAGNQELLFVFSAGNSGPSSGSIGSPGTGKNVVTVGAGESVQAFGGPDACLISDSSADSAFDIASFSSRGPTQDGRKKPDLVAPGTHVSGGAPQAASPGPSGSGLACYLANTAATLGICGGPGSLPAALFFPQTGQQLFTASSGTSHAAPAVAGAAAVLNQHFRNQSLAPPSPAMMKAVLVNSTRYMTGAGAGDSLWSGAQGMGSVDLAEALARAGGTPTALRDQLPADVFTASGQTRTFTGTVADPSKPFRVTLAWTDAPGPTFASAWVNDLDLAVTVGGTTYLGNVFSGSTSVAGGSADGKDNVESVFLPAGVTGTFEIKIAAANIAGDGIPGSGTALDQDFALVAYNASLSTQPVVTASALSFVSESCAPGNGAADPAETVTLQLSLANSGSAPVANLVATLVASADVTSPSGPQTYGPLAAGGPPVAKPFTFTVGTYCGGPLDVTLQLQDGATNLGNVVFPLRAGVPSSTTISYSGPAVPIPDATPAGIEIPLVVSGLAGAVQDVDFRFDGLTCSAASGSTTVGLDHTAVGDLVVTLVSPAGTAVTLMNRPGTGPTGTAGNNFCQTILDDESAGPAIQGIAAAGEPYTGSFLPATPLAALDGQNPNGTWRLRVADLAAGETGSVRSFSLIVTTRTCCGGCTPPAAPTAGTGGAVCEGDTLQLTASGPAGAVYAWTGPAGFLSTQQNPSLPNVTSSQAGLYAVTATLGCTSTAGTTTAVVRPLPSAPTAASDGPICVGGTLHLTASTVPSATYQWTGPNGFGSTQQNPTVPGVSAASAGTYSVVATVNGCAGPAGQTLVSVTTPPAAPTLASNSPLCEGSTLNLTASAIPGATFQWTGPNGFTSTQQNPSLAGVTASAGGSYSVTALVGGCTLGPVSTSVTVKPRPATPQVLAPPSVCTGGPLALSTPAIPGATYQWTGPGGFVSTQQSPTIPSVTPAAAGTYAVVATVNGCDSSPGTASVSVIVTPDPVAPGNGGSVCEGQTLQLLAPAVPVGSTYQWTGPNGFTSTLQNPTIPNVTPAANGIYSLSVVRSGCASPSLSTTVAIAAGPPAPVAGTGGAVCEGQTLLLTATSLSGATYAWTGPNGFTSTLQNPTIPSATPAASGTYRVRATVNGCASAEGVTNATVIGTTSAPTVSNNGPLCVGQTLQLSAVGAPGATYAWTGPGGFTSAQQSPVVAAVTSASAGAYTVTVTASGCTSAPATTTLVVNQPPPAPAVSGGGTLCEGGTVELSAQAVPGATYQWTGPNGFTSTQPSPSIANATPAASGTYTVVAVKDGCSSAPASTSATVTADVDPPSVVAPAPVRVRQSTCQGGQPGATASSLLPIDPLQQAILAAFLAGGTATDTCATPSRLDATLAGQPAGATTFFPVGASTVSFRFVDAVGNVGVGTSTVTVLRQGDVDGSDVVDVIDNLVIQSFLVGNVVPGSAPFTAPSYAADADGNGTIDLFDVVLHAGFIVGNVACLTP